MNPDAALIVTDMLYDFIDGSLACAHAVEAVAAAKAFIDKHPGMPVLFICDHHPANHCSFTAQGGPWPVHCVASTHGGAIHEDLFPYALEELTFFKGENPAEEQYSGAQGRNTAGQSLAEVLSLMEISTCIVCGIATEYCVRNTCEDLLREGFRIKVLTDALGYVQEQGHLEALAAMRKEGIRML